MALDNSFTDIPGTTVFDANQSRKGYWLNQFCMSLMKPGNRDVFRADERAYLDRWPMSEEQKQAVRERDLNRCIELSGNIYFLVKIGATDGISVQKMVGSMTGMTEDEYRLMMLAGGRSPEGNRSLAENARRQREANGSSPPCVVLLPGLLCDHAVWRDQIEALAFAQCTVASYGESSSITAMAESVLSRVQAPRFSLAGHSMGGRVALEVARLAPARVERLALLDTGIDPMASGPAGEQERDKRMALLRLAKERGMRRMGETWARGMVHPDRLGTPLFEAILDMIERQTPALFGTQIEALLGRPDAREVLQGLSCPTLIACGRQDAWSPLARHEDMHALCPVSRLEVIEDSGHMSTMERPDAVAKALVEWMASAPQAPT